MFLFEIRPILKDFVNNINFQNNYFVIKSSLCCKTIFCHKVTLEAQFMDFFIWRKKMFRSWDMYVFVFFCEILTFLNRLCHHRHRYMVEVTLNVYFFWILSTIKMTFGRILVRCMTNISNMPLNQCWIQETGSSLFYDFIRMVI